MNYLNRAFGGNGFARNSRAAAAVNDIELYEKLLLESPENTEFKRMAAINYRSFAAGISEMVAWHRELQANKTKHGGQVIEDDIRRNDLDDSAVAWAIARANELSS